MSMSEVSAANLLDGYLRRSQAAAGPPAFVGAYDDIPSIVAVYGMRRTRAEYTSSILRLRRDSDNDEADFTYDDVSREHLDTALVADFLNGANGYSPMWYDQKSGYDAVQTTAASQPLYVAAGQNGRPVLRFDGTDDGLAVADASGLNPTATISMMAVAIPATITNGAVQDNGKILSKPYNAGWTANYAAYAMGRSSGTRWSWWVNNPVANELVSTGTISASVPYIFAATYDGSNELSYKNGSPDGTKALTGALVPSTRALAIGKRHPDLAGEQWIGDIAELIICNAALSTSNRQAAEAASSAYWSVF